MYQSRVKTWLAGETLYAADLNAEFDGILATLIPEPASTVIGDVLVRGSSSWERFAAGTSGYVFTAQGAGAKPTWAAAAAGFADPMTTQGDIIYRSATATTRLPTGDAGKALTTGGVGANPVWAGMTTQGDIEYHSGTTRTRLPKGTAGQALKMNAGETAPEWGTFVVTTSMIENDAVTDAAHYYSASETTLPSTAETEIGTVTVTLNTTSDSVGLSASVVITQRSIIGTKASVGPIIFRIRRSSITGTILATATATGPCDIALGNYPPVILMGADLPATTGSQVYKFTAVHQQAPGGGGTVGKVNYKRLMCRRYSK